jgi:hypothetical protein
MIDTADQIQRAAEEYYDEGRLARARGVLMRDNPHGNYSTTLAAHEWARGWLDEHADIVRDVPHD